jgi:hypothetical protein
VQAGPGYEATKPLSYEAMKLRGYPFLASGSLVLVSNKVRSEYVYHIAARHVR